VPISYDRVIAMIEWKLRMIICLLFEPCLIVPCLLHVEMSLISCVWLCNMFDRMSANSLYCRSIIMHKWVSNLTTCVRGYQTPMFLHKIKRRARLHARMSLLAINRCAKIGVTQFSTYLFKKKIHLWIIQWAGLGCTNQVTLSQFSRSALRRCLL
jgi:hypothetical protein